MTRRLRSTWGGLLLLAPRQLLTLCGGDRSRPVVVAARFLGARHVIEGALMTAEHEDRPPTWIVAIDAIHAASMLVLAAASPRLRRDALISAGCAVGLVGLSVLER